jgi:hypothetical protein
MLLPTLVVPVKTIVGVVQVMVVALAETVSVGKVVFVVMVITVLLLQPVTVLVAVAVYVPEAFTIDGLAAFVNEPPFHSRLSPTFPVAVKVILGVEQVILLLLMAAVSVGKVVFVVMIITVLLLQPVTVLVAVAVYVPAAFTMDGFEEFNDNEPPFHTILFPELVVPVKTIVGVVQVMVAALAEAVNVGKVGAFTATLPCAQAPPEVYSAV